MANWRAAKSITTLRKQLNEMFPQRSKISDGIVGDLAHSQRASDHNPNGAGVVTAFDITHDPKTGVDCHKLAKTLQTMRDPRIKYLIWNGRITQKTDVTKWKGYSGKNPHKHHLHLSVSSNPKLYDDAGEWNLSDLKPKIQKTLISNSAAALQETPSEGQNLNSATDNPTENQPPPEQTKAVETSKTFTDESGGQKIEQSVETKNEQDVNQPATVTEPPPQGFLKKLAAGVATVFGGTLVYDAAGKFSGIQFSTQAIYVICFLVVIAFLGFCVWAVLETIKQNKRTEIEALAKTAIDRKDIVWVKPEGKV
jgi:hypothetical protein